MTTCPFAHSGKSCHQPAAGIECREFVELRRQNEMLREAVLFVLSIAEEEWCHPPCPTNGLKAVKMMRDALSLHDNR